jgi:regulator of protease activity HflC (stomatin/prohibitin superfamily)
VIYFCVIDPRAIIRWRTSSGDEPTGATTSACAASTIRRDAAERDRLNIDIQEILDAQTDAWGIKVANVEIKHIDIDESMIRAIAKQAEAERVRRAKIINAEGEQQAAEKLVQAANIIAGNPQAMQLRYLGALHDIANERTSTIVFPFPMDLLQAFGVSPTAGREKS